MSQPYLFRDLGANRHDHVAELTKSKKLPLKLKEHITSIGNRFVNLELLVNKLWCETCDIPLSFSFAEAEHQRDLSSIFNIRCFKCLSVTKVPTSRNLYQKHGSSLSDINCKAAAGCLDAGIGHEQLKKLMSSMNMPIIHHKTMKRAEAVMGKAFEVAADASCKRAIAEEKKLTFDKKSVANVAEGDMNNNSDELVGLVCEYDFGWDKRGNGFTYDSRSGRGSVIGHETGKMLAYNVLSSVCAMCFRGHPPDTHDCRKNHDGSAKSMEPASAVDLLTNNQNFKESNVKADVLVGDEDASIICHVQRASQHEVKKWIDINHAVKKFSNKLYSAAKKHKFLSSNVIKYLKRCFSYVVAQNKDNVEGLRKGIRNIGRHTFKHHQDCGDWCKAREDEDYVFKHLPSNKAFSCPRWEADFKTLLESYADKAEKLAPGGSSQKIESFNHLVVTRAPKSRFYGSSAALSYRVAAAVLQKNEGASYISDVYQAVGMESHHLTTKYRGMIEEKRKKKLLDQQTIDFKRRRLLLKTQVSSDRQKQRKEGVSYISEMGPTMDRAVAATAAVPASTLWIPEFSPLQNSCTAVIVDTETMGFGRNAEIIQIAAQCKYELKFSGYMLPEKAIHASASQVTGLSVSNHELHQFGKKVITTPSAQLAKEFIDFLKSVSPQIVIVGHNILKFDAPLIWKWLKIHNLENDLCSILYGFCDTVPLLRQGKTAKLEVLAQKYLTQAPWKELLQHAHDAGVDCSLLVGLLDHFNVTEEVLIKSTVTTKTYFENCTALAKQRDSLPRLSTLKSVVSDNMLKKMAKQGITIEELEREYLLHERKGIEVCLGVCINGKPRVTVNNKIINAITEHIKNVVKPSQ